jgi:hypothetical protein
MKHLPQELLAHVFCYLDLLSTCKNIQLVSHAFNEAALFQLNSVFSLDLWKCDNKNNMFFQSEDKQNVIYKRRESITQQLRSFSALEKILTDINTKSNATPITKFSLDFCACLVRPIQDLLIHCPNLEELSLRGNVRVNDRVMEAISTLPCMNSIKVLNISSCRKITDAGIATICESLPNLTDLHIRGIYRLSDKALVSIANKVGPRLRLLDLQGMIGISNVGLSEITKKCTSLEYLSLQNCPVVLQPQDLETLHKLKTLILINAGLIQDEVIESIVKNCTDLTRLEVQNQHLLTNKSFCIMQNLTRLNVMECSTLDNDALQMIGYNNPLLEELELKKCSAVDSEGVKRLEQCRLENLRILNLTNTSVDEQIVDLALNAERRGKAFSALKILNLTEVSNVSHQYQKAFFYDKY